MFVIDWVTFARRFILSLAINCVSLDKEDFARNYSIDTAEIEYNNNAVLFLVESVVQ